MKIVLVFSLLAIILLTSSFDLVYGQSNVDKIQGEVERARQLYNAAIGDLMSCDLDSAESKAYEIHRIADWVTDSHGQMWQSDIITRAGNNIVDAINYLDDGRTASVPDLEQNKMYDVGPCNIPFPDEDANDDIIVNDEEQISHEATIGIPTGTSSPGCDINNECFIPFVVKIASGGTVVWENNDSASHTVTSGTTSGGPDGIFDSSMIMSKEIFSVTFEDAGTYDYFCIIHPWMTGEIIVIEEADAEEINDENISSEDIESWFDYIIDGGEILSITPDVEAHSLIITMTASHDGSLEITLPREYIDATMEDQDDIFFVLVDGEEVDFEEITTSMSRTLTIQFPADADEIVIIGTYVIPEFGSIIMIVMTLGFFGIIFAKFQKIIFKA